MGGAVTYEGITYAGTSLSAPLVSAAVAQIQDLAFELYATRFKVDDVVRILQVSGSTIITVAEQSGATSDAGVGYVGLNVDAALELISDRAALEGLGINLPNNLVATTDLGSYAAQVFRLFDAAFCRLPMLNGLSYWTGRLEDGVSLMTIASEFLKQPEFDFIYGSDLTDMNYVVNLFNNALGRDPKPLGQAYWANELKIGMSRGEVLARVSESPEHVESLQEIILQGLRYEELPVA